jgi:TetR/AcrR family transcriptional regulator, repressor of the ameABC operon
LRRPRRRAEETRQDILATAEALFRQYGIAKTSIADIALDLGMSPANIFKHFHSKTALVDAICERHISRMIEQFTALNEPAPAPDRLALVACKLMETHLQHIRENPFFLEMMFAMSDIQLDSGRRYGVLIESLFSDLIRQGVETGVYHCDDCTATGRYVSAAFVSVLHPVFLVREDESLLRERCHGLADLVNAALQCSLAK